MTEFYCKECEYAYDTPLGSFCALTREAIETTECHYDEETSLEKLYEY